MHKSIIIKLCLWAHTCKDIICMTVIPSEERKRMYAYIGEKILYNVEIKFVLTELNYFKIKVEFTHQILRMNEKKDPQINITVKFQNFKDREEILNTSLEEKRSHYIKE